jgi:phosphatidate cytidylyltransferase
MSSSGNLPRARSGSEMALRVFFGLFMAVIALALAVAPVPQLFAAVTVIVILFAAHEWHRLVRSPQQRAIAEHQPVHLQTTVTGATAALAVIALMARQSFDQAWLIVLALTLVVIGAVAAFVMAQRRNDNPAWHAFGVVYLVLPTLALVALRIFPSPSQGTWVIVGLFVIVWATDTGALMFGKLIGGKKLWPAVSPGKTWAGTLGGTLTAIVIYALLAAILSLKPLPAILFALCLSVVAHLGDLFESWVKRRFGTKDSGGLIPGHGGVLDRMDSMFACSIVLAVLVFGLHINPMFGGHS